MIHVVSNSVECDRNSKYHNVVRVCRSLIAVFRRYHQCITEIVVNVNQDAALVSDLSSDGEFKPLSGVFSVASLSLSVSSSKFYNRN